MASGHDADMPRTLVVPPHLRSRAFTLEEARSAELTRHALSGPRFQRLFRTTYACSDVRLDDRGWIDAARMTLPGDAVAVGTTGLRLLGVNVGPLFPLTFASVHPTERRDDRVKVRRCEQLPTNDGRVATPEHCMVGSARRLDLVDWVAAADSLLYLRRTTIEALTEYASHSREWGSAATRTALPFVRAGAESVRETVVRLMLTLAGLPEPECNVDVLNGTQFLGRGDLVYREWRVIVEYDGRQHIDDVRQWEHDVLRLEGLAEHGWVVIRVTHAQLKDSRAVVERVHAALDRGGYQGPPPAFTGTWARCFGRGTGRRSW